MQPSAEAQPTIHVHIGRIELRAVPATTHAQPQVERPKPPLSLDDYLSGRRDGRREAS